MKIPNFNTTVILPPIESFILRLDDPIKHENGNELTNIEIENLTITPTSEQIKKFKSLLNGDFVDHIIEIPDEVVEQILLMAYVIK